MYRNKKDVDKHVESLLYKLSTKDFKVRAYSVARLYYDVGDYGNCQKYVEQYLSLKSNNAAAHKLLGLAFQKLGDKERALEQFKTSLDIDPAQTATILDVCELLADEEVTMDIGRAKYWCEKAEATFPKHPITFRLKERLLSEANPDPEALENLLKSELIARPKDAILHARLLKHYLHTNQIREACEHSCNVEFDNTYFRNNYAWYETLMEILKYNNPVNTNDWMYQLLLLTVKEKLCHLSLTEVPNSVSKKIIECNDHLFEYDQAIQCVNKAGPAPGFGEFHTNLLQHHQGQLAFHAATFLLKKANKDLINWSDATKYSAPLMLVAWQIEPMDPKINWLSHAPSHQQKAARQWYLEGSYRCSQSGHYILANIHDDNYLSLDKISQLCSGTHWRDKLFEKIFTNRDFLSKIVSSHLASASFKTPAIRLPRKTEVQVFDENAQRVYPNSLHHFVWMLLNYKQLSDFKCTLFDMLTSSMASCGPETLSKIDIHAFLYCTTITVKSKKRDTSNYISKDKPIVLPANITNLLCTLSQMKWWDCAYKLSQNELGSEYTDIRSTLSRGIEVVRCIDNHGLDPELLCLLGRIFNNQANISTAIDEKSNLEARALLYYSVAIPLLEKIRSKTTGKPHNRRMFDYVHKEFDAKELNNLMEESKVYVAVSHLNEGDYEKVIDLLSNLKSPQAYYHLGVVYKKIALDEKKYSKSSDKESKYLIMLSKAKQFAYKALHKIKDTELYQSTTLYTDIQTLIEETEILFNKTDVDISNSAFYDNESKYSSDDNESLAYGEPVTLRSLPNTYRNISSTPKHSLKQAQNCENYRTAIDSQILNNSQTDISHVERIEKQIKSLQKRETTISDFMEQTKEWFQENRNLGNQIMSTINSNIENTTEQFKLLRISVGQVKEQIDECRNECKDVADLKKQIAELKKEVNKLKKPTSEQAIDDNELYNLEEEYRTNDIPTNFGTQIPFAPHPVLPPFAQRMVPPFSVPSNPYQLYGQHFYNLYNQYSQFSQTPAIPGAQQLFDPTRTQMNYPSVYTNPDQMYLDVAHLIPPNITGAPPVQAVHTTTTSSTSSITPKTVAPPSNTFSTTKNYAMELKDMGKSLPVNVVITSSDPLPSCTTAPPPILSVTIPTKHIKGSPHNYQIAMPTTSDVQLVKPPIYTFPSTANQSSTIPVTSTLSSSNRNPVFMTSQPQPMNLSFGEVKKNLDKSASIMEGIFSGSSPNTSLNKSRTLSEKSNTSIENYDPCPDFKPIVPLPAEVTVTTGEEDESVIFKARAKLFRFIDKQWKERGIGEMKLLKHKVTGKVRVLMRREQVHKICANHIILPEMEIKPMKNESKAYFWVANDFAEETVILEKFCIRFKTADIAKDFYETFTKARQESVKNVSDNGNNSLKQTITTETCKVDMQAISNTPKKESIEGTVASKTMVVGGFTFSSAPTFKIQNNVQNTSKLLETPNTKANVFSGLSFKTNESSFQSVNQTTKPQNNDKLNSSDVVEEYEPNVEFKPVVPLPALIDQKTGEEDENVLFEHRAKLLRFDAPTKEWKERGLGNIKLLEHKENNKRVRLLMRREQIMKICCNHAVTKEMTFQKMPNMDKAVTWCAKDFSDGELVGETFCLRFKTVQACDDFIEAIKSAQSKIGEETKAAKEEENAAKLAASTNEPLRLQDSVNNTTNWGNKFKPKANTWECNTCLIRNDASNDNCSACNSPKDRSIITADKLCVNENTPKFNFGIKQDIETNEGTQNVKSKWGDQFKPKQGTWECQQCLVRNDGSLHNCSACNNPRDPLKTADKESKSLFSPSPGLKFSFGIPQDTNNVQNTSPMKNLFSTPTNQKFSFGIPQKVKEDKLTVQPSINATLNIAPNEPSILKDENKIDQSILPKKVPLLETPKTIPSFGENKGADFDFSFTPKTLSKGKSPVKTPKNEEGDDSDNEYASEDEGNHIHFSPIVTMPDKIQVVTGEENEEELYAHRAKLYRFTTENTIQWKERGIGIVKILKHKDTGKLRVLMRREQVLKICLNHTLTPEIIYKPKDERTWIFAANDFSEEEFVISQFCLRFSNKDIAQQFKSAVDKALENLSNTRIDNKPGQVNQDDDVVFVSEIQASSEEKQKAKDLMLPENFYTYKNKFPCQGCRGCDDGGTKADVEKEFSSKSTTPNAAVLSTPAKIAVSAFQSPANSFYGTPTNSADKTADTSIFRTPLGATFSNTKTSTNTTMNSSLAENNKENTFAENDTTLLDTDKKESSDAKPTVDERKSSFTTNIKLFTDKPVESENKSPFGVTFGEKKSIFGEGKPLFGENKTFGEKKSIFGEGKPLFGENKPTLGEIKSIFGDNKPAFGENKPLFGENKSIFGENKPKLGENKPVFGENNILFGQNKPILGDSKPIFSDTKSVFGENKSVFGETKAVFGVNKPIFGENKMVFGSTSSNKSLFGFNTENKTDSISTNTTSFNVASNPANIFAAASHKSVFNMSTSKTSQNPPMQVKSVFGSTGQLSSGNVNNLDQSNSGTTFAPVSREPAPKAENEKTTKTEDIKSGSKVISESDAKTTETTPFKVDNSLSFAVLSSSSEGFGERKSDFQWEGAGQPLFVGVQNKAMTDKSKNNSTTADETAPTGTDEDYDPYYEPIVPLPDEIVVTTGEEDEEKLFSQRCKLYRYDEKPGEWKERGVGELKLLYHPGRQSYRLLLRREQVHKLVLNMLLFMDLELLPMKNSDSAWAWAGRNFAESAGEQETLAVRFKTPALAKTFYEKVMECVRKLQVAAAEAIRKEKEAKEKEVQSVTPLRLPKHLESSARADDAIAAKSVQAVSQPSTEQEANNTTSKPEKLNVQFDLKQSESEDQYEYDNDEDDHEYDHEDYHDYENNDDSDGYYNEDDEDVMYYFGKSILVQNGVESVCEESQIEVTFDPEVGLPKIIITDTNTGEVLADIRIEPDTQFMHDDIVCTWSGVNYTTNAPVDTTAKIVFADSEKALEFYDNCETSKAATYSTEEHGS